MTKDDRYFIKVAKRGGKHAKVTHSFRLFERERFPHRYSFCRTLPGARTFYVTHRTHTHTRRHKCSQGGAQRRYLSAFTRELPYHFHEEQSRSMIKRLFSKNYFGQDEKNGFDGDFLEQSFSKITYSSWRGNYYQKTSVLSVKQTPPPNGTNAHE